MKKSALILLILFIIIIMLVGCSEGKVYGEKDTNISVEAGKTFIIKLDENQTTGYMWNYVISDESIVTLVKDDYSSDDKTGLLTGSGGKRILTFKGLEKGTTEMSFANQPSYEENVLEASLVFYVEVK